MQQWAARRARIDDADRQLVKQRLHAAGVVVSSVCALEKDPAVLRRAAPLLLDLMAEVSSMRVKADLVRVMSGTRISPKFLVDELRRLGPALEREPKTSPLIAEMSVADLMAEIERTSAQSTGASTLAWSLADALSDHADASVFDEIVDLVRDKRFGTERQMLPYALAKVKSRRGEALQVLVESLGDKDITPHTLEALGRMKAIEALPAIRPYLESANRLVRTEALKAIKKIEKAASGNMGDPQYLQAPPPIREGLAEASMNFEIEDVPPFLAQVSHLVEGFGHAEIEQIESTLLEMEPDDEIGFDFTVHHCGRATPLQIRIFMDDVGAPDVGFFTSPQLAEAVGQLMGEKPKQQSPCEK